MSRVSASANVGEGKTIEKLGDLCEMAITDIINQVNGNLEFDKNMLTQTIDVTFSTADTEVSVVHRFGKTPTGYIVCKKSVACDVYDGSTSWSSSLIYLKCSVANAVVKLIIKGS